MPTLGLTQSQTLSALRAFLLGVLPNGVEVTDGQDNRVPEPQGADFVVMTPILRSRLATNVDDYVDALFTGLISGVTLTISAVSRGALAIGSTIFGVDVLPGTVITAQGTGRGGVGTYSVNKQQGITSRVLASGVFTALQPTEVTVQLDVHGPASADNVQIISTLLRDGYGVSQFDDAGFDVEPLYTSDPRQAPFLNGEQQIEFRWSIDAVLQCNPVVTTPQQFADALALGLVDVEAVYPP